MTLCVVVATAAGDLWWTLAAGTFLLGLLSVGGAVFVLVSGGFGVLTVIAEVA